MLPTTEIRVRFAECDPYGHVNHGVYLTYFEVARIEVLERLGVGLSRLLDLGVQLVVIDVHLRFRAAATVGDVLTVHTEIVDLRPASSRWRQQLRRGDVVVAEAEVRAATTDRDGRPTAPPQELVAALRDLAPVPGGR